MTYYTLAGFLNTTTVILNGEWLTIAHGPVPWRGNKTIQTDTLDQLDVKQSTSKGRNGISYLYTLCAVSKVGHQIVLMSGLDEADQALFIEQRVEAHLE